MDKTAEQIARPTGDYVLVRAAALDWLFGEGPDDDGFHFGDEEAPRGKGAFWWRSKFRAMIAARPADSDMVERVLAKIHAMENANVMGRREVTLYFGDDDEAQKNMEAFVRAAIAATGSADMGKGGEK